jgi:hypothetical protein
MIDHGDLIVVWVIMTLTDIWDIVISPSLLSMDLNRRFELTIIATSSNHRYSYLKKVFSPWCYHPRLLEVNRAGLRAKQTETDQSIAV